MCPNLFELQIEKGGDRVSEKKNDPQDVYDGGKP
jgi:hypothetical protein